MLGTRNHPLGNIQSNFQQRANKKHAKHVQKKSACIQRRHLTASSVSRPKGLNIALHRQRPTTMVGLVSLSFPLSFYPPRSSSPRATGVTSAHQSRMACAILEAVGCLSNRHPRQHPVGASAPNNPGIRPTDRPPHPWISRAHEQHHRQQGSRARTLALYSSYRRSVFHFPASDTDSREHCSDKIRLILFFFASSTR